MIEFVPTGSTMARMKIRGSNPDSTDRIHVAVDRDLLKWIDENLKPGGPFGSMTHAVEFALRHLRDEQEALRQACKENKVPFKHTTMWLLYQELLDKSRHR